MHAPRKALLQAASAEQALDRVRRVLVHAKVFHAMRLGEILIQRKLITEEDLERALELQKERGDKTRQDAGRHGLHRHARRSGGAFRTVGHAAGFHRRAARCLARNRNALAALPAPVPLPSDEPGRPYHHARDGRSAGCRNHRRRAPLHRSQDQHRARARAGDRRRDRQILRRIGRARRRRISNSRPARCRRIWNTCATWRARRRSSAW